MLIVFLTLFQWMILTLIFASSITLAFEDKHLDSKPDLKAALFWLNLIFTIIFVIEMLLKWLAMGLWGYFTNIWTILDAFIVVVSPFCRNTYTCIMKIACMHTEYDDATFWLIFR